MDRNSTGLTPLWVTTSQPKVTFGSTVTTSEYHDAVNLTSFEKFCGNSPFWDTSLFVDSEYPKFTPCFRQVALVWIPCFLYMVACIPYLSYLSNKPSVLMRVGVISTIKIVCTVCLLGITIATITVHALDSNYDNKAFYVSEGLKAACFLLTIIVNHRERRKARVASPPSWLFWLALVLTSIVPFYSNIEENTRRTDKFGFIIFYCYFAFLLISLVAASFVEPKAETHTDVHITKPRNPCPEYESSVLSRITFWWMTGLVILGFKRTLIEEDIYDLASSDRCENLMPPFIKSWEKEKVKVKNYNDKIRESTKSDHKETSGRKHGGKDDEKIPLLLSQSNNDKEKKEKRREEESPYKTASVLHAVMSEHGPLLFMSMTAKMFADMINFCTPKITEALLDYIGDRDAHYAWYGYALAASYLIVNLVISICSNQAIFYTKRAGLRMRSTLINAIYRKSLTVASIGDETSKGEIVNLMSVDCQRIEEISNYINFAFSAPFQIIVAFILLYQQLGVAALAGMAVLIMMIPINLMIGRFFQKWQFGLMKFKDRRVKLLTETLNGIKVLKFYAWEGSFHDKIEKIRSNELSIVRKINVLIAVITFLIRCLPSLAQVAAFGVNVIQKGFLNPTVAFVSLQLFNMLNGPLTLLPLFMPSLIQTVVSMKRIGAYLNKPDIKPDVFVTDRKAPNAVKIEDGNFTWTLDQPISTLRNINMKVEPGSLVAVVGTVGSGKSSLLSAMLGEMERLSGNVTLQGSVAYVPQEAWIQNATLKDNILFGKDFRQGKYNKIIEACALKSDLAILPGGDKIEIGEKGINISGGQKQRVSLARAVYSDQDIYLLDDPLSAVDSHVGKHIFTEVIGKKGVLRRKTRVLVTHGIQWLPMVDKIFVITNGVISESGNYTELLEKNGDFAQFLKEYSNEDNDETQDGFKSDKDERNLIDSYKSGGSSDYENAMSVTRRRMSSNPKQQSKDAFDKKRPFVRRQSSMWETSSIFSASEVGYSMEASMTVEAGTKLIEEEISSIGTVKKEVYKYYLLEFGIISFIAVAILYLLYTGAAVFTGIWLTRWTSDSYLLNQTNSETSLYDHKTSIYIGVYAGGSIAQGAFAFCFSLICFTKMVTVSRVLHKNMLFNILRSPMSFFDTTPNGRLVNRFSRDVEILDNILPRTLRQAVMIFAQVLITIINISYGTPIFLAALLPLAVLYVFVQTVYIPTCRQLRRINSVSRSPIYVHLSETLSGASSIRAYGCQERFVKESVKRIDHNIKFFFSTVSAASWLSLRLQFLGNLVVFAAAIFAVAATDIDSSVVGLSVSYAASMTQSLESLVTTISDTETNIVSVERLKEYTISPTEADWILEDHRPNPKWPEKGNVSFNNYQTRYRPGLELVLKDVNCYIKGGENVGIVGRTGAGKSSMTVALFRIIEAAGGQIIIDGEDISKMGLHDLRNKITILPQDPVMFSGSIRFNLDPFDNYSENDLWHALEQSSMKEFVQGMPGKLEYECGEEGSNLSVGQRQLLCLTRTLLRKTKILVLDEATAAVDMETDDFIQKTIRREFKDSTVLTIAHRLNTIIDYDKVMVLDKGKIKEFDDPSKLLEDENSIFYSMAKDARNVQ